MFKNGEKVFVKTPYEDYGCVSQSHVPGKLKVTLKDGQSIYVTEDLLEPEEGEHTIHYHGAEITVEKVGAYKPDDSPVIDDGTVITVSKEYVQKLMDYFSRPEVLKDIYGDRMPKNMDWTAISACADLAYTLVKFALFGQNVRKDYA